MKRILKSIILCIVAIIVVKISTFGWRIWEKSFMDDKKENAQLTERLKQHVYRLAHEIGERSVFKFDKLQEAARYIIQIFESFGYTVEFQEFYYSNNKVKNIIVTKSGIKKPNQIIIIGAHYDTCFNPGADDNASAVAGLLELANFMRDKQTNRTMKFIAFVNEEPPFFKTENMGSRIYTKNAKQQKEDIKAAIILESIGYYTNKPNSQQYPPLFGIFYPNKGNFIGVVGNFNSRWLVKEIVSNFKRNSQFPIESVVTFSFVTGIDFSDNWSFWKDGFPAVMITDTAFYRNPHYHAYSDTYEKLDYDSMSEVVKGLGVGIITMDNKASHYKVEKGR